jgi:hypothetical protein
MSISGIILEEEARRKRLSQVFSNTYKNGGWSDRDSLPVKDPIGDVDEDFSQKICDCGTNSVYGKVPIHAHANFCSLKKGLK